MTTISYIKLYGPPLYEAIKLLEKVATETPEVCIMDTIIQGVPDLSTSSTENLTLISYFQGVNSEIKVERCNNIISKSGHSLGDYDFFFEWFTKPSMDQFNELIKKIDEVLMKNGCRYSISTKF